jgi:hypothetical protein
MRRLGVGRYEGKAGGRRGREGEEGENIQPGITQRNYSYCLSRVVSLRYPSIFPSPLILPLAKILKPLREDG